VLPKIHKKGTSFKGAALYLLHDKESRTSDDRVAWTQAHNIAVNDPDMAWRIMAATALDRDRLKEQAGIPPTGNKSDKCVLHLSISWREDEAKGLTQEDMQIATSRTIKTLGAQDHQSLVIAHTDTKHPHVHILINRVNPEDGRMLSSSKEKAKLQALALEMEKERGKIYCENRVLNAQARERGEYTRYAVLDRRMYDEISQHLTITNDNRDAIERARMGQKTRDAALAQKGRDQADQHREDWKSLIEAVKADGTKAREAYQKAKAQAVEAVRMSYRPQWRDLHRQQQSEIESFHQREESLMGRLHNALQTASVSNEDDDKWGKVNIKDIFANVLSKEKRLTALENAQALASDNLRREQKSKERIAIAKERETFKDNTSHQRTEFLDQAAKLKAVHEKNRKELQQEWRNRHKERNREWHDFSQKLELKEKAKSDFTDAASQKPMDTETTKARIRDRLRQQREADRDKDRGGR